MKKVSFCKHLGVDTLSMYLGKTAIKRRIKQGKLVIRQLNSILYSKQIRFILTKIKILKSLVECMVSIVTYGADVLEITHNIVLKSQIYKKLSHIL